MADDDTERREEADGGSTYADVAVLRSGREEARIVLDKQIQVLSELHKKAIRTVRITGFVFGLMVSAAALPEARQFINGFTLAGVGALAVTILSGLVTYSASDLKIGVGPQQLAAARTGGYDESEWFDQLVSGYEDWLREMEELNDGNARLLTFTQFFLGIGILLLGIGIVVEAVP